MQGRLAAQEVTGQLNLAGDAGMAFAQAVGEAGAAFALAQGEADTAYALAQGEACAAFGHASGEAAVQDGIESAMGELDEGEPEEKESEKPDDGLSPSSISALLLQGAYHIHQAADVEEPIVEVKTIPFRNDPIPKAALPVGGLTGGIVPKLYPERASMPFKDDSCGLTATSQESGFVPSKEAIPKIMAAGAGIPMPESALSAAKGMDELDHADFKIIRKLPEQGTFKTAQPLGVDTAWEALKPSKGTAGENVKAAREPEETGKKAGGDKEKPVQAPVSAMVMAHGTAKALQAESMQSAPDMTPENTVREENVAMQVARASMRALRRGAAEYRIRLSPEGLGEVEVTVVTKGKAVSLSMRTDNEAARGLILGHADELRAELGQQSYQVDGLSVEVGMDSGNGAGFFAPREHAETAFDQRRATTDQDTAAAKTAHGLQTELRRPLPRSGTINYRI